MIAAEATQTALAEIVGAARVGADPAACAALSVGGKAPPRIVYPSSGHEVAQVLGYAAQNGLAVIPCRGASQLGIGNAPRRYDLALSLKDMNQVWHYEPADLTLSAEPGIKLADLQRFVGRHGLWLPLDPPGGGRASVGGILATNAAGPLRLRYGAPRDMVLGMKIATTQGKIVKTGGRVVKNVAGYDLAKLLIGSYGTLGVIVEAAFKLYPLPAERASVVFTVPELATARELRRRILASPLSPLRMVLLEGAAAGLVEGDSSPGSEAGKLVVELGGSARVLERGAQLLEEAGRGTGGAARRVERQAAEKAWARIADFPRALAPTHDSAMILKASLPVAAGEEFLARALQAAKERSLQVAAFAQVGVGIVQVCVLDAMPANGAKTMIETLRQAARGLGGALVVVEAPPDVRNQMDVWGPPGDDFEIMRKLKSAWDPKGILAPGRYVGGL